MLNWFTVFHILPRDTMSPTTRRKLLLTPKLLVPTNETAPPVFGSNAQVSFCQTQPKLQVKHSFKTELALFSFYPVTHPGKVSSPAHLNPNLTKLQIK